MKTERNKKVSLKSEKGNKMARHPTFATNAAIGEALRELQEGKLSRFLTLQLIEKGFVAIEVVHKEGRGRPAHNYVLTGKGKFAKNWGGKKENIKTKKTAKTTEETHEVHHLPVVWKAPATALMVL
jgi:predicted ArsR family transcriptional regulator